MTDLLTPATRTTSSATTKGGVQRPLALGAAAAGLISAGSVLTAAMAVGLVAWFASDAGAHGDTRDALRVGADGWLLAHGSGLDLAVASVTMVPLGLTALCGYVAYRLGRWAAATSAVDDLRTLGLGTVVMAGVYGVVVVITAVLASVDAAQPRLGRAFAGGVLVAVLGGGPGLLAGSGLSPRVRSRLPETLVAVATGAAAGVLMMFAAAALLLAVSLGLDFGSAANVLSLLRTDAPAAALYTLVVAAVTPNAVLMGTSYLVGPGFAVGTGSLVAPTAVVLGPLPAFPLVAALPADGPTPWWATWLVVAPVLAGLAAALLMTRRFPVRSYELGALRGAGAGAGSGLALTLLVGLAGGAVGPGRMADIGAPMLDLAVSATVSMGIGGVFGGLLATWLLRRRVRAQGTVAD